MAEKDSFSKSFDNFFSTMRLMKFKLEKMSFSGIKESTGAELDEF